MSKWEDTGTKATEEERKKISYMIERHSELPVVVLGNDGIEIRTYYWNMIMSEIKKIAIAHGLPERTEYYGMDKEGRLLK